MSANYNDNDIIQIFLPIINDALIADGFPEVKVKQANQPTQQGVNTAPTVYFFKVANKRYGWLGRNDIWDINAVPPQMIHTESQYIESTWQLTALVLQNPTTPNQYTASDLINEVASIMQSDNTRAILNNSGIGILRVSDIRNPYFVDDRDNFEASPSFDFVLTYQNIRNSTNPIISTFTAKTVPV
jgi:hypothetical protein